MQLVVVVDMCGKTVLFRCHSLKLVGTREMRISCNEQKLASALLLIVRMPVDGQTNRTTAIDATAVTMEVTLLKEPTQWTANQDMTSQTLVC